MAFILPGLGLEQDTFSFRQLPPVLQGLVALVLIFDIYTIFQQLQIHRMRNRLAGREELFRLISENAADMIAVVDMEGQLKNSERFAGARSGCAGKFRLRQHRGQNFPRGKFIVDDEHARD
jgi:PAS domain-containing protein